MSWVTELTSYLAPFFIVMSPILSYGDQVVSMHRNRTSAGFSLDIPLIMLVASFLRFVVPLFGKDWARRRIKGLTTLR